MATDREYLDAIESLVQQGRKDDARFLMQRYQAEKARRQRPLGQAIAEPVQFESVAETERKAREAVEEAVAAEVEAVGTARVDETEAEMRARLAREKREQQERQRGRAAVVGADQPLEPGAIFRPTRIREVETVELPEEDFPLVLSPEALEAAQARQGIVAEAQIPTPYDPLTFKTKVRRMYRDPSTGILREPTLGEEFRESAALQTERGEAALRQMQADIKEQQRLLDLRIQSGEDVPFYERYVGSILPNIATEATEVAAEGGPGTVETPLGAALRAVTSYSSATAAEGYFRGLGYEVDERGLPVDEDDFGYQLKQFKDAIVPTGEKALEAVRGVPVIGETVADVYEKPLRAVEKRLESGVFEPAAVPLAVTAALREAGLDTESLSTVENALQSALPLAVPIPGFATERTMRKTTTFDPEGRRRVMDTEVPSFIDNPKAFFEAEAKRITENVAKGRTFGDEYLDTPVVRDYYAHVTGDPDDAYIAGMVPEIFVPGPEVLLGPAGYATGVVADVAKLGTKARSIRALRTAKAGVKTAEAQVEAAKAAKAAASKLTRSQGRSLQLSKAAQQEAEARKALRAAVGRQDDAYAALGQYDDRILNRLTRKASRKVLDDADVAKVDDALKAAKPTSFDDAMRVVKEAVGSDKAAKTMNLVWKNLPGDFVPLTDVIAVPRTVLKEAKDQLSAFRQRVFLRAPDEMFSELYDLATRMPEGKAKELVKRTYNDLYDNLTLSQQTGAGYKAFPPQDAKRLRQAVRAAARETGVEDATEFMRRFDQRKPNEMFREMETSFADELAKYDSWDDVPAALRRQAIDAHDMQFPSFFAKGARRTRDITRAQMYFKTMETGLDKVFSSPVFSSPFWRRFKAKYGKLQTETFANARTAREIQRAGKNAIRTLRAKLLAMVKQKGNVDDAIDTLLELELKQSGESPQQAWEALWGHLYGDKAKDDLMAAVRQDAQLAMGPPGPDGTLGEFTTYPNLRDVRAIDTLYSGTDGVLAGDPIFKPSFQKAMLKVVVENGMRKNVARSKILTGAAGTAPRSLIYRDPGFYEFDLSGVDEFAERIKKTLPFPERAITIELPEYMDTMMGVRAQVYDKSASVAEKMLAENGEALYALLDDIPVRQRADVQRMANDAYDTLLGKYRRNLFSRLNYGYILPNLPMQLGRMASMGIIPMVTIGARNTLDATGRLGQKALAAVTRRRLNGGGLTTTDGIYYSPKMLEDLAEEYDLGVSLLDSERVGSLADDMMRDANKLARRIEDPDGELAYAFEYMNPMDRGYFLRMAESVELNFRKSVFEMALARGDAPAEAAELARKSQFDLTEVPDVVYQYFGRHAAESGFLYRMTMEGIAALARNPKRARAILRGMRVKAEVQDPYNVHGDKALKSLGIVTPVEDKSFYLPELPFMQPVEGGLSAIRHLDNIIETARFANKQAGVAEAALAGGEASVEALLRVGGEVIAPAVIEAYDTFQSGEGYTTQGVPGASPMTDEKAFWGAMMVAHAQDPERTNGRWKFFMRVLQPRWQKPPPDMAMPGIPLGWTRQPPEGVPHILWDVVEHPETGKMTPVYYAAKPSSEGLTNLKLIRGLTPDGIEAALPLYAMTQEPPEGATRPQKVYATPAVPETLTEAAVQTVLPATGVTVPRGLQRQAEVVRGIREDVEVE